LRKKLTSEGHALVPVEKNLVDAIWEDKPPRPVNAVMVQPLKWTGMYAFDVLAVMPCF